LYLALELTLLVVAVGMALLWLLRRYGRNALLLGQEQTKTGKAVFASVSEFLSGIKLVKSYSMEHFYHQYFENTITQQRQKQLAFKHSNSLAQQLFQISAAILLSILLYAAITVFAISSAELLILAVIFVRLMPLLSSLQRNHEQILHMLPAYASAMHLQEECVAAAEDRSASGNRLKLEHGIHLQDVAFAYKVDSPTLKQVNVSIPASRTTAIIGASGAGKSTLADMLAGLMLPDTGAICIDDVALNANNLIAWRSEVAYVPQEVFLFHDTLRANMRWVAPTCSDNDIWQALELAAAQHFVEQLPQGLDTVIGERGIRLSGGERQRIALARAL
jgi:ATP-binding cassette subfamily C protein